MRTIRYRAWSLFTKTMSPPVTLRELAFATHVEMKPYFECLIFMQFIGHQAASGDDGYEGDIVRNRLTNTVGQIKWDEEAVMFCIADKKGDYVCSMGAFVCDGFTILGNIYQNPEWSKS